MDALLAEYYSNMTYHNICEQYHNNPSAHIMVPNFDSSTCPYVMAMLQKSGFMVKQEANVLEVWG